MACARIQILRKLILCYSKQLLFFVSMAGGFVRREFVGSIFERYKILQTR